MNLIALPVYLAVYHLLNELYVRLRIFLLSVSSWAWSGRAWPSTRKMTPRGRLRRRPGCSPAGSFSSG
jgi:hypothetical protein